MKPKARPAPEGVHTATPRLFVRDAAGAVEFYKGAFGAAELGRSADPSGKIVNAEIRIGDSNISLAEESPEWGNHSPQSLGGVTTVVILNVADADAVWQQARAMGAREVFPLNDQPYGYRQGRLADPFGHCWIISAPIDSA